MSIKTIKRRYSFLLQPLDVDKFADVRQVLKRNIEHDLRSVKAPLALPEAIEIGDYATVKVLYCLHIRIN